MYFACKSLHFHSYHAVSLSAYVPLPVGAILLSMALYALGCLYWAYFPLPKPLLNPIGTPSDPLAAFLLDSKITSGDSGVEA